jgi:hypothetical protein
MDVRRRAGAAGAGLALIGAVLVAAPGTAVADKPTGGCPAGEWLLTTVPLAWQSGQPIPDRSLWGITLEGLVVEFESVRAGLAALGATTLEELYATVLAGAQRTDRNNDGMLCLRLLPRTPGIPAYIVNGVDNVAHAELGARGLAASAVRADRQRPA